MADPPPYPDTGKDTGKGSDRESTASHPGVDDAASDQERARGGRWASKVVIAIVAALVVVIVILHSQAWSDLELTDGRQV